MYLPKLLCLITAFGKYVASATDLKRHRQRLPVDPPTIIQHLQTQHALGNRNSHFKISVTAASDDEASSGSSSEWRLQMQELPLDRLAISPNANLSVYDRNERIVGDLGYSFLSVDTSQYQSTLEESYGFLIVDWNSNTLNGVLAKQDEVVYIDERSLIFVEPPANDPVSSSSDVQYQLNIALEIGLSLVKQIGEGSLCHTISYLNSLFTATNEILMREVQARLIVSIVNQTSLSENLEGTLDEDLGIFGSRSYTDDQGIDMTYIFSGSDTTQSARLETVCGPNPGFGTITRWNGNVINWGDGWWMDLNQLLKLVGQNLGLKVTDAASLLGDHIASFSGLLPADGENQPVSTFDGIRAFLATSRKGNSCRLIPSANYNTNSDQHYERNDCPSITASEYTKKSELASIVSNTSSPPTGLMTTNIPSMIKAEILTNPPTEDLFKTLSPTRKPSVSPTISERPSSPGNGLPTATTAPTTDPPVTPPTAPFPTYKPTDGTSTPTLGDGTFPPTEEAENAPTESPTGLSMSMPLTTPPTVSRQDPPDTGSPSFSLSMSMSMSMPMTNPSDTGSPSSSSPPSFLPSPEPSLFASVTPSITPSSSLMPTEQYRPSASPSQSSGPSKLTSVPSNTPSAIPSSSSNPSEVTRPSAFPSLSSMPSSSPNRPTYNGEPTHSIAGSNANITSFGCPSSPSETIGLILDGTTDEFVCDASGTFNRARSSRSLEDKGFIIEPELSNPSIVKKLRVYADHDCSGCDPVEYILEGLADDQWVEISKGDLPWKDEEPPPPRNDAGISIEDSTYDHGDDSLSYTEATFENTVPYSKYKLSFPATRDETFDLVVAEVELPGVAFDAIPTDAPTTSSPTLPAPPKKPTPKPTSKSPGTKTPKPPGTKTPKPPVTKTNKPTNKKTPRPTKKKRRTQKPTKKPTSTKSSKSYSAKSSKSKGSKGYTWSKWDDIFVVQSDSEQNATTSDKERLP